MGKYLWLIALGVVVVGFLLRLQPALQTFLNPDEVYNYLAVNQSSVTDAYRASMKDNPHPPLYYILLHLWSRVNRSDIWLRLLSVLSGTAGLWFAFKWLEVSFNKATALAGLIMLAFTTEYINLSAELRDYALLTFLLALSLFLLERSVARRSAASMAFFSATLALALLDDYAAFWVVPALFVHVLIRVFRRELSRVLLVVWVGGQVAVGAVGLFVYRASVSGVQDSELAQWVKDVMLRASYFHPGEESFAAFILRATLKVFHYVFTWQAAAYFGIALFLFALVWLLVSGTGSPGTPKNRVDLMMLLLLPFLCACAAAIAGFFPYGGSRHSFFLMLPVAAGFGFAVSALSRHRVTAVLVVLLVLLPVWKLVGHPPTRWMNARHNMRREYLLSAVDYLRDSVQPGQVTFSDQQTQLLLRRYLCPDRTTSRLISGFTRVDCAGGELAAMGAWGPTADSFVKEFRRAERVFGLQRGERVWVASAGWDWNMAHKLECDKGIRIPGVRVIRDNIAVFPVRVGYELASEADRQRDEAVARALRALARSVAPILRGRFRTVILPTYFLYESTAVKQAGTNAPVASYASVYESAADQSASFGDFLPALAFWVFGTNETHPIFMRYMNDRLNYVAAGYRFTLIAEDPDTIAAVYLIEETKALAPW